MLLSRPPLLVAHIQPPHHIHTRGFPNAPCKSDLCCAAHSPHLPVALHATRSTSTASFSALHRATRKQMNTVSARTRVANHASPVPLSGVFPSSRVPFRLVSSTRRRTRRAGLHAIQARRPSSETGGQSRHDFNRGRGTAEDTVPLRHPTAHSRALAPRHDQVASDRSINRIRRNKGAGFIGSAPPVKLQKNRKAKVKECRKEASATKPDVHPSRCLDKIQVARRHRQCWQCASNSLTTPCL